MDQSQRIILTPFNFFEWKDEKINWHNRRYGANGLLCLSISRDLLFHLDSLTYPNEEWDNIEYIFGKIDDMRGHQIENEFTP